MTLLTRLGGSQPVCMRAAGSLFAPRRAVCIRLQTSQLCGRSINPQPRRGCLLHAPPAHWRRRHRPQEGGSAASYGDQRVFASIGWGAFGVIGGVAIKQFGIETAPFVGYGLLSLGLAAVGVGMRYNYAADSGGGAGQPAARGAEAGADASSASAPAAGGAPEGAGEVAAAPAAEGGPSAKTMGALLRRPDVAIFLFEAAMLGFGMGVCAGFEFLYLQQLGGSEAIMGLCLLAMTTAGGAEAKACMHVQGALAWPGAPDWGGPAACMRRLPCARFVCAARPHCAAPFLGPLLATRRRGARLCPARRHAAAVQRQHNHHRRIAYPQPPHGGCM
jgi:hypothetical protein